MVATNPAGQSEPEQVERDQALARHSEAERALRDRIKDGGFVVALSGGGHRASLAALGSLMAIVDRGLAKKLIQVASVSGGSITNAFVAQRCRLEDLGPCELDETAAELATTIIRRGVLTDRWIALLILAPLAAAITSGLLLRQLIDLPSWLAVSSAAVFAVVLALTALIARGLAIEWLLDRRYFRHSSSAENRNAWGRAQFTSLSGGRIDHVFCMTDLVLGLPVYASSQHGGMIWRRLKAEPYPEPYRSHRVEMQTFNASHLSIAEVVRASAAFPGIPPRRLRIPRDPQMEAPLDELPQVAFLGDGGLWNNLGTQVAREDRFLGSCAVWEKGFLRPYDQMPEGIPLLCFNGSAPLKPARPFAFQFQGLVPLDGSEKLTSTSRTKPTRVAASSSASFRSLVRMLRRPGGGHLPSCGPS